MKTGFIVVFLAVPGESAADDGVEGEGLWMSEGEVEGYDAVAALQGCVLLFVASGLVVSAAVPIEGAFAAMFVQGAGYPVANGERNGGDAVAAEDVFRIVMVAVGSGAVVLDDEAMSDIGVGIAVPAGAFIEMDIVRLPDGEVDEQTVLAIWDCWAVLKFA